ncbi:MAG: RNA polymerase sporulation sigma factor SigH [Lachnospiraceae bacterium]
MEKLECYTDEELIEKLRAGEEEVMDYIMEKYKTWVRKKANELFLIGGDTDDLIQEGMIGLFKALRDYEFGKETTFRSFADLCIKRQMYSAIEASNRKKHLPLNSYISLNGEEKENDGMSMVATLASTGERDPQELFIDKENLVGFYAKIRQSLSPLEWKVLNQYVEGKNYAQIARDIKKSEKTVDNALQRIKNKISSMD